MFKLGQKLEVKFSGLPIIGTVTEFDDERPVVSFLFGTTKFCDFYEVTNKNPKAKCKLIVDGKEFAEFATVQKAKNFAKTFEYGPGIFFENPKKAGNYFSELHDFEIQEIA